MFMNVIVLQNFIAYGDNKGAAAFIPLVAAPPLLHAPSALFVLQAEPVTIAYDDGVATA